MIVCDTGPLVAAAVASDKHHRACVRLFTALRNDHRQVLVPGEVVAEVGYMLSREGSAAIEAALPLGTTDAVVIALTEALHLQEVATIDHRHFSIVRPRHTDMLTLLPEISS